MGFILRVMLLLFALGLSGCLRSEGDCQESGVPPVSGSWEGVVHLGAKGSVPLTFNLNQNNDCVNGAWVTDQPEAMGGRAGALSGVLDGGGDMELRMDPAGWDACAMEVILSLRGEKLVGRMRPVECAEGVSGSLEFTRATY